MVDYIYDIGESWKRSLNAFSLVCQTLLKNISKIWFDARIDLRAFCDHCQSHQRVEIEDIQGDELNERAWGDIVCKECRLVIATFSAALPGRLVFEMEGDE